MYFVVVVVVVAVVSMAPMASMCMHGTSIYESTALSKDVITNHPGCLLVIRSTWNQIPGRVCHNLSNGKHEGTRNLPLDSFLCNRHQSGFYIEGVSKFPRFWKNRFTIHKPTKVSRVPSKGFSAGQGIMISTESMQSNCYDVYDPITIHRLFHWAMFPPLHGLSDHRYICV